MPKTISDGGVRVDGGYRERLTPSLWAIVSAAVVAPMAGLVFVPLDHTVALVAGVLVAILVVLLMVTAAPVIAVRGGELRAGRAHIPVSLLGPPQQFTGDDARLARGPGLDPRAWHVIRGGMSGIVRLAVIDPDDPTPMWVVSTRTPDRLAAAIVRAQNAHDRRSA